MFSHWPKKNKGKIGGEGKIVEVDKSLFTKWRDNARRTLPPQLVFGGYCRETAEHFLVMILNRNSLWNRYGFILNLAQPPCLTVGGATIGINSGQFHPLENKPQLLLTLQLGLKSSTSSE